MKDSDKKSDSTPSGRGNAKANYGKLMAAKNAKQKKQEIPDHTPTEGRQKLLSHHLHEIRRFDSGDYFSGHIPDEEVVSHHIEGHEPISDPAEKRAAAVAKMKVHASNRRMAAQQSTKPQTNALPGTQKSFGSKSLAQKLMSKKQAPSRRPPTGQRSSLGAAARQQRNQKGAIPPVNKMDENANSKYTGLGEATGRQVMLQRMLKEKPNLQRFDSGDYFIQQLAARKATNESLPVAPPLPPNVPVPQSNTESTDALKGRNEMLARKLRETKRFDSGDYFSGLQSNVPQEPPQASPLDVPSVQQAQLGSKVVAQRSIRESHQRFDSADYSMKLAASTNQSKEGNTVANTILQRNLLRMQRYQNNSSKPKQPLP